MKSNSSKRPKEKALVQVVEPPVQNNYFTAPIDQLERAEFSARFRASFRDSRCTEDQSIVRIEELPWRNYNDDR